VDDLVALIFAARDTRSAWKLERERLDELLRQTVRIRAQLDELELALVQRLRQEHALTWRELGEALGLSAQTAHRRYAGAVRR
jgi:DNA-binding XRE family transcriptional regulator